MNVDTDFLKLVGHFDTPEVFEAGSTVFEIGDPGKFMYLIKDGEVQIKINDVVLETVYTGGIIGEMALLDGSPRSATAVAITDCELIAFDERRFLFLIQQTPWFAIEVMRVLAKRLRVVNPRPKKRAIS